MVGTEWKKSYTLRSGFDVEKKISLLSHIKIFLKSTIQVFTPINIKILRSLQELLRLHSTITKSLFPGVFRGGKPMQFWVLIKMMFLKNFQDLKEKDFVVF